VSVREQKVTARLGEIARDRPHAQAERWQTSLAHANGPWIEKLRPPRGS
jgi:hypothetical protein